MLQILVLFNLITIRPIIKTFALMDQTINSKWFVSITLLIIILLEEEKRRQNLIVKSIMFHSFQVLFYKVFVWVNYLLTKQIITSNRDNYQKASFWSRNKLLHQWKYFNTTTVSSNFGKFLCKGYNKHKILSIF